MRLKLTIDIFSGRPNPYKFVEGKAAEEILKQLSSHSGFDSNEKRQLPEPFTLGYRGLIIEHVDAESSKHSGLPKQLKLTPNYLFAGDTLADIADLELEKFVFDNLRGFKNIKNKKDFRKYLQTEIPRFRKDWARILKRWPIAIPLPVITPKGACRCAPTPDLAVWNDSSRVGSNNCYNYACNYWTNTFAQPGNASGGMYTDLSNCAVPLGQISALQGAISDGLISTPNAGNQCPGYGHLVALVIAPNFDFHWYRKGPNGKWSHKPGGTPATLLDNSGNPITDPRSANRGPYSQFCTFMKVIDGWIKIS